LTLVARRRPATKPDGCCWPRLLGLTTLRRSSAGGEKTECGEREIGIAVFPRGKRRMNKVGSSVAVRLEMPQAAWKKPIDFFYRIAAAGGR